MGTKVEAFKGPGKSKEQDDGVASLWTDFTQNTGFHGVNKLTPGRQFKFRCCWWTFAVISMAGYMSYNVANELINYYKYPAVTSSRIKLKKELEFPAITICNHSPLSRKRVEAKDPELLNFYERINPSAGLKPIDWDTEFLGPVFRDSVSFEDWKNMSMDHDAMLIMCNLGTQVFFPCTKATKIVLTSEGMCQTFNFNASDVMKVSMTGENLNFILIANVLQDDYVVGNMWSAGLKVYLHEAHVHPDTVTSSFLVSPGTTTSVGITMSSFKYLEPPFKAFGDRYCLDTSSPSFNNTLENFDTYTYGHCVYECILKKTSEQCGCSWSFDMESDMQMCSLQNITTCYMQKYMSNKFDADLLASCDCDMECEFNRFEAKVSSARFPSNAGMNLVTRISPQFNESYIRDNFIELKIYYEDLLTQSTEQTPQYTVETIIGNLGGQMGICLGASFLTLTELFEFLIFSCLSVFSRSAKR